MLVLSRYEGEKIIIGDDIVIQIVSIQGDKVRIGIDAPKNISVHRLEVYDRVKREGWYGRNNPQSDDRSERKESK